MKVRKIQKVLLFLGFASVLLATVLFMLTPFMVDTGFQYSGVNAFVSGVLTLFSFKFDEAPSILFAFLFIICLLSMLGWFVVIMKNKNRHSVVAFIFEIFGLVLVFSLLCSLFAAKVTFNDKTGILFSQISSVDDAEVGKVLTALTISLVYLSLMSLTLYAFVDMLLLTTNGAKYREQNIRFERNNNK